MDTAENLKRKTVSHQMSQVSQAWQDSYHFETRIAALRFIRDYERVSNRIAYPSNLAHKISSVVGQHSCQQPDLYNANSEIIDRLEMIQNERSFKDPHHSTSSGNALMNPSLHSILLSCRICGQWPFSNYIDFLGHENSCPVSFIGGTMMRQQRASNNEILDTDQLTRHLIDQDTVSDFHMPIAEGIWLHVDG